MVVNSFNPVSKLQYEYEKANLHTLQVYGILSLLLPFIAIFVYLPVSCARGLLESVDVHTDRSPLCSDLCFQKSEGLSSTLCQHGSTVSSSDFRSCRLQFVHLSINGRGR